MRLLLIYNYIDIFLFQFDWHVSIRFTFHSWPLWSGIFANIVNVSVLAFFQRRLRFGSAIIGGKLNKANKRIWLKKKLAVASYWAIVSFAIQLFQLIFEMVDNLTFLSHCWCKYLRSTFFFSVTITICRERIILIYLAMLIKYNYNKPIINKMIELLCSDGYSSVGK